MTQINCAKISKIDPDIILTDLVDRYEVELADVKELNEIYLELAQGEKIYSIINGENKFIHFSNQALKYLSHEAPFIEEYDLMRGSVIVAGALPGRIIVNIFWRLKQHIYPIKVVSTLDQAMSWIEAQRKKD